MLTHPLFIVLVSTPLSYSAIYQFCLVLMILRQLFGGRIEFLAFSIEDIFTTVQYRNYVICINIKIMKEGKDHRYYQAESLQKNLLSTRYSVIDQMASIKETMSKQQSLLRANKQKAEQLQRKITMLEAAENKSKKITNNYRNKLSKLESSQEMMINLHNLQAEEIMKRQKQLEEKRHRCLEMRESLLEKKRKSVDLFQRRKSLRVQNFKQKQFSVFLERQRRSQADFASRKQRKDSIRNQQLAARTRLHRYRQFKIAQAQFNYQLKKQQQVKKHAQKLKHLQQLTEKIKQQKELFRKTQILGKQAKRIQSFYLTNQPE